MLELASLVPDGRRVRMVAGFGAKADSAPAPDPTPDPLAGLNAALATMATKLEMMAAAVDRLEARLYEGVSARANPGDADKLSDLARAVERMAAIVAAPVEPVYGKDGKLIGARRTIAQVESNIHEPR